MILFSASNINSFFVGVVILFAPACECFTSCLRHFTVREHSYSNPPGADRILCRRLAAISPGDTIAVFGATGGIGQLVTRKLLLDGYNVRVVARNASSAASVLSLSEAAMATDKTSTTTKRKKGTLEIKQIGLLDTDNEEDLKKALQGASGIVLTVGTTAFPTKKWAGGNTPKSIDNEAIRKVSRALMANKQLARKVVLVTSIGVTRTKEFPFVILNLFGVLDAKRAGEEAIQEAAAASGGTLDYAIIRPGRLVGGPWSNLDLAKLMKIEGGAENGVKIAIGDSLLGDCKRDACAEAVLQCLKNESCKNLAFSIASNEERAFTDRQWTESFTSMREEN